MAESMEATVSTSTGDNKTQEPDKSCAASNNIQVQPTINGDISSSCNGISAYSDNSVVWVRLGQSWWPGTIAALERCPHDFVRDLKKTPLAVVKFFEEQGFVDIHKTEHIYPYNCERKKEFIKKGLNLKSIQNKEELFKKFESDVLMAQTLTGGSLDVFTQIEEDSNKRRIDYSNLGFGPPKPKKKKDDACRLGSDITEAVHYKKDVDEGSATLTTKKMKLEHKVVIMEQPHIENMKEDLRKSCTSYTCHICGFSCSRLGVIVWHNKGHIKTVMNYDTGIRIPGRRKRKVKAPKHKAKLQKLDKEAGVDHAKTNGHLEQKVGSSLEAKRLLLDWEDEEEENNGDNTEASTDSGVRVSKEQPVNNGFHNEVQGSDAQCDEPADNDGSYCRSRENRSKRLPMRHPDDLNSAFDALLADTPSSGNMASSSYVVDESSYTNNDSDSDASNWEKYYDKDSDNEDDQEAKESDIKSLCEGTDRDESDDIVSSTVTNGTFLEEEHDLSNKEQIEHFSSRNAEEDGDNTKDSASYSPEPSNQAEEVDNETNEMDDVDEEDGEEENNEQGECDDENNDDALAGGDEETNESDAKEENGARSSLSSSPSNSCPAFMLVAVDAHGKNVPMPALTDPNHSSNLVAVEASMEDGTSRTLYIDPAYLEPNVDLSNLMLHIDNSGQETVIIPSTTGQDTPANATPPRDSTSSSNSSSSSSSSSRHSRQVPTQAEVTQHNGGTAATALTEVTSSSGANLEIGDAEEEVVYDGRESSYIYTEKDHDVPSPIEGQQEAVIVSTNTVEARGHQPAPTTVVSGTNTGASRLLQGLICLLSPQGRRNERRPQDLDAGDGSDGGGRGAGYTSHHLTGSNASNTRQERRRSPQKLGGGVLELDRDTVHTGVVFGSSVKRGMVQRSADSRVICDWGATFTPADDRISSDLDAIPTLAEESVSGVLLNMVRTPVGVGVAPNLGTAPMPEVTDKLGMTLLPRPGLTSDEQDAESRHDISWESDGGSEREYDTSFLDTSEDVNIEADGESFSGFDTSHDSCVANTGTQRRNDAKLSISRSLSGSGAMFIEGCFPNVPERNDCVSSAFSGHEAAITPGDDDVEESGNKVSKSDDCQSSVKHLQLQKCDGNKTVDSVKFPDRKGDKNENCGYYISEDEANNRTSSQTPNVVTKLRKDTSECVKTLLSKNDVYNYEILKDVSKSSDHVHMSRDPVSNLQVSDKKSVCKNVASHEKSLNLCFISGTDNKLMNLPCSNCEYQVSHSGIGPDQVCKVINESKDKLLNETDCRKVPDRGKSVTHQTVPNSGSSTVVKKRPLSGDTPGEASHYDFSTVDGFRSVSKYSKEDRTCATGYVRVPSLVDSLSTVTIKNTNISERNTSIKNTYDASMQPEKRMLSHAGLDCTTGVSTKPKTDVCSSDGCPDETTTAFAVNKVTNLSQYADDGKHDIKVTTEGVIYGTIVSSMENNSALDETKRNKIVTENDLLDGVYTTSRPVNAFTTIKHKKYLFFRSHPADKLRPNFNEELLCKTMQTLSSDASYTGDRTSSEHINKCESCEGFSAKVSPATCKLKTPGNLSGTVGLYSFEKDNRNLPAGSNALSLSCSQDDSNADKILTTEEYKVDLQLIAHSDGHEAATGVEIFTETSNVTEHSKETVTAGEHCTVTVTAEKPSTETMADEPFTKTVATEKRCMESMIAEKPLAEALTAEEPFTETLTAEAPFTETLAGRDHYTETLTAGEPLIEILPAEEPLTEIFTAKEPLTETLTAEEVFIETLNYKEPSMETSAEEPVMETLATEEPFTETLSNEEPVMEALIAETLSNEEPVIEALTAEEPLTETLSNEEPVMEALTAEEPFTETLSNEEPAMEALIAEEPFTETLSNEEPVMEALTAEEPLTEPLANEEPVMEALTAEEPLTEPLANEEPVMEALTAGEPFTETLSNEEPAMEALIAEEPFTETLSNEEPVMEVLTAEEPFTEPLANEEPVMEALTAEEPLTEPLANEEPVMEALTAGEPFTETLSNEEPVMEALTTEEPLTEPLANEEPAMEALITEEPLTETLANEEPVMEALTAEEPFTELANEEPVMEALIAEEPLTEPLANEEPVMEALTAGEPLTETLSNEEPVMEALTAEEPLTETLSNEEPVMEALTAEEPLTETLSNEEPVMEVLTAEEPLTETLSNEEPVMEALIAEEPFTETLSNDEPVMEALTAEEPLTEPLANEEPAMEALITEEPLTETLANEEPVMEALTAEEPFTEPLANEEPVMEALTAEEPFTEPLANEEPVMEVLTAEEPFTEPLADEEPVMEALIVEEPLTETLSNEEPVTEALTAEEPLTETLSNEEPVMEALIAEEPLTETLSNEEPVMEALIVEEPITETLSNEEPVREALIAEEPLTETLSNEEPVMEALIVEEPLTETLSNEEPVMESLTAEEPLTEPLSNEEPVMEALIAEEPLTETLANEEPVMEALTAEEPLTETLANEKPVMEALTAEEPLTETLANEEPVMEALTAEEPLTETLANEEPVMEALIVEEPLTETLSNEEPVMEALTAEKPLMGTLTTIKLITKSLTVQDPCIEKVTSEAAVCNIMTSEKSVVKLLSVEMPISEAPATDDLLPAIQHTNNTFSAEIGNSAVLPTEALMTETTVATTMTKASTAKSFLTETLTEALMGIAPTAGAVATEIVSVNTSPTEAFHTEVIVSETRPAIKSAMEAPVIEPLLTALHTNVEFSSVAPTTEAESLALTSMTPVTEVLTSVTSVTEESISVTPVTKTLTSMTPVTEALTFMTPVTEALTFMTPVTEALTFVTPVTKALTFMTPVTEALNSADYTGFFTIDSLIVEASTSEVPIIDASGTETTLAVAPKAGVFTTASSTYKKSDKLIHGERVAEESTRENNDEARQSEWYDLREIPMVYDQQESIEIPMVHDQQESIEIPMVDDKQESLEILMVHDKQESFDNTMDHDQQESIEIPMVHDKQESLEIPMVHDQQDSFDNTMDHDQQESLDNAIVHDQQENLEDIMVHDKLESLNNDIIHDQQESLEIPVVHNQPERFEIPMVHDQQESLGIGISCSQYEGSLSAMVHGYQQGPENAMMQLADAAIAALHQKEVSTEEMKINYHNDHVKAGCELAVESPEPASLLELKRSRLSLNNSLVGALCERDVTAACLKSISPAGTCDSQKDASSMAADTMDCHLEEAVITPHKDTQMSSTRGAEFSEVQSLLTCGHNTAQSSDESRAGNISLFLDSVVENTADSCYIEVADACSEDDTRTAMDNIQFMHSGDTTKSSGRKEDENIPALKELSILECNNRYDDRVIDDANDGSCKENVSCDPVQPALFSNINKYKNISSVTRLCKDVKLDLVSVINDDYQWSPVKTAIFVKHSVEKKKAVLISSSNSKICKEIKQFKVPSEAETVLSGKTALIPHSTITDSVCSSGRNRARSLRRNSSESKRTECSSRVNEDKNNDTELKDNFLSSAGALVNQELPLSKSYESTNEIAAQTDFAFKDRPPHPSSSVSTPVQTPTVAQLSARQKRGKSGVTSAVALPRCEPLKSDVSTTLANDSSSDTASLSSSDGGSVPFVGGRQEALDVAVEASDKSHDWSLEEARDEEELPDLGSLPADYVCFPYPMESVVWVQRCQEIQQSTVTAAPVTMRRNSAPSATTPCRARRHPTKHNTKLLRNVTLPFDPLCKGKGPSTSTCSTQSGDTCGSPSGYISTTPSGDISASSPVVPAVASTYWWPAYVTEELPSTSSVGVKLINSAETDTILCSCVRSFTCDQLILFMQQRVPGVFEAYSSARKFVELQRAARTAPLASTAHLTAKQFFDLRPDEQDKTLAKWQGSDGRPSKGSGSSRGRRSRQQSLKVSLTDAQLDEELKREDPLTFGSIGAPEVDSDEDAITDMITDMNVLSARESRKLQSAVKARHRDNECLMRFMKSPPCLSHLHSLLEGAVSSGLHERYWRGDGLERDDMKAKLRLGPLHMDEYHTQVNEMVSFLRDHLTTLQPSVANPAEYVILVWLPEAIRHALRVVKRVPEADLEGAMQDGYNETPTERKVRRLFP